jgi:CspA family cold shock protein
VSLFNERVYVLQQVNLRAMANRRRSFYGVQSMTGKVKFFSDAKGYGFLLADGYPRGVFVHRSEIEPGQDGKAILLDGEAVEFEPVDTPKGTKAVGVRRTGA